MADKEAQHWLTVAADFERRLTASESETERLRVELKAMTNFLRIALDAHDGNFGVTDAAKHPLAWDVQARKWLNAYR